METLLTYRIYVYVPADIVDSFIEAVGPHIPSFLGHYDHVCWWSEPGTEQYRHIKSGQVEQKPSCRLEISLPRDDAILHNFINEIVIPHHPWKEPVITISEQKIVKH